MTATETKGSRLVEGLRRGRAFLDDHAEVAFRGHVRLEAANHLLRVWIEDGSLGQRLDQIRRICAAQHEDGGWGDRWDDVTSRTRTTAFVTQMLIRVDRELRLGGLPGPIESGLGFIEGKQLADGCWADDHWPQLDATSVSVGTLLFCRTGRFATMQRQQALQRGIDFVLVSRDVDGLWRHRPGSSPVEITAHLLQKCYPWGAGKSVDRAAYGLVDHQKSDGYWDRLNVDATCDAARSLMVAALCTSDRRLAQGSSAAVESAVRWLLSAADSTGGFGSRPGSRPSILFTADVVDTFIKYRRFREEPATVLRAYL